MVATLNQATERIYQTFQTDWGTTSVFTFDNEEFDPPEAGVDWVRLAVRHFDSNQETLGGVGNRKFLREGRIFVQCFTALDKGRAAADNLATIARNIFEGKTLGTESIRCTDSVVREIGPIDDGFYQVNVEIAFNYDEVK